MANLYTSSVGKQLAKYDKDIRRFLTLRMRACGKKVRSRLIRERLSGPPGLNRISGRLQRSIQYRTKDSGEGTLQLIVMIGGKRAPYARKHIEKIGFARISAEEMNRTIEEIRIGIQFFGKDKVGAGFRAQQIDLASLVPDEVAVPDTLAAERASTKERFDIRSAKGRRNWTQVAKQLRKTARKRRNRPVRAVFEAKAERIERLIERSRVRSRKQRTKAKRTKVKVQI